LKIGELEYEPCGHTSHWTCIPPRKADPNIIYRNDIEQMMIDQFKKRNLIQRIKSAVLNWRLLNGEDQMTRLFARLFWYLIVVPMFVIGFLLIAPFFLIAIAFKSIFLWAEKNK
jgi:hypothetical protein